MSYSKTNWTPTTPINPSNLNKMEEGIRQNAADIENLNSNLDDLLQRKIHIINSQETLSFDILDFFNKSVHIISSMYSSASAYYIVLGNYSYGGTLVTIYNNENVSVSIERIQDGQCRVFISNKLPFQISVETVII